MIIRCGLIVGTVLAFTSSASGCQFPYGQGVASPPPRPNTAAGSVFGGASGSLIGAAIGSSEGKTGEGALIGGLIGAATGGILGKQVDRENELRSNYYRQQQQRALNSAVTFQQVVQMTQNGLSSDVVINQINSNGIWSKPTTSDLISLKQNGVSDQVITALQNAWCVNDANVKRSVVSPFAPAPVYRERHIYVEPARVYRVPPHPANYWRPYPPRVGHWHHHHGYGGSVRIKF